MSKALRWSERWFRFGLWIVAVVFASFLIGLGGNIVENLPRVEQRLTLDSFLDQAAAERLRSEIEAAQQARQTAQDAHDQAQLKLNIARSDASTARDTFNNWLATRRATQRAEQDQELIARTGELDALKAAERKALAVVQTQQQVLLDQQQAESRARQALSDMREAAGERYHDELRGQELRVFGYRLALTLPLLAVAGWLFARQRKSSWWPFVWGFIYFALFAFFVELVPYIPSYGGWVRYVVGIVLTVLVGRYAIIALNRYLERQKQAEALPDVERRKELSYDVALARLGKKVCPGCERAVDLTNTAIDYCPHCGICLFDHCTACNERKSAFARFCHACGAAARS
ncbi:zinc ribbon domain-containing protein [Azonexus hydrophilus]|uniref:zinc ribbon domain-containing protein n=1 Tax=Azonexus hydrophilus TaxID=418702 RepID=UPI0003F8F2F4|nr:zinc ribbon domain-containing protein [Azonexus hydrophilus]